MPRQLYELEGQTLRLIANHIETARAMLGNGPGFATVRAELETAERIIQGVLDDGPARVDEED